VGVFCTCCEIWLSGLQHKFAIEFKAMQLEQNKKNRLRAKSKQKRTDELEEGEDEDERNNNNEEVVEDVLEPPPSCTFETDSTVHSKVQSIGGYD
jgi:hypothetical protein